MIPNFHYYANSLQRYTLILTFAFIFNDNLLFSQLKIDSASESKEHLTAHRRSCLDFVAPTLTLGLGTSWLFSRNVRELDILTNKQWKGSNHTDFHIEDYLQYSPTALLLLPDQVGINYLHPYHQRFIYTLGTISLSIGVTHAIKALQLRQRPDKSNSKSFPSGHTSFAFATADLVYMETRHNTKWIGICVYTAATMVGFLRIRHEKHWLTDVVAGAGIGIITNRTSFYLLKKMKKHTNRRNEQMF